MNMNLLSISAVTFAALVTSACAATPAWTQSSTRSWSSPSPAQITADLIGATNGSAQHLAERMVEQAGFAMWNGEPPVSDLDGQLLDGYVVVSGHGPTIAAFFDPAMASVPAPVCVIRTPRVVSVELSRAAKQWCADQFGVALPRGEAVTPFIVREGS
jgi:hypothetical protein